MAIELVTEGKDQPDLTLELKLRVVYSTNGVSEDELAVNLMTMVDKAMQEGQLTGSSEACVESKLAQIDVLPTLPPIPEGMFPGEGRLLAYASRVYGRDFSGYRVKCMFYETYTVFSKTDLINRADEIHAASEFSSCRESCEDACEELVHNFLVPDGYIGLELVKREGLEEREDVAGFLVLVKKDEV